MNLAKHTTKFKKIASLFLCAQVIVSMSFIVSIVRVATASTSVTYYVDSVSGSDSNSGTDISQPWQTINKVNNSSFNPGDSILFKRGDTWREQLNVGSSGSVTSPITIGAYGSGNKPQIVGSDLVSSWNATGQSGVYSASLSQKPTNIYVDSAGSTAQNSILPLTVETSTSSVASIAGSWFWSATSTQLYIQLSDSSNPSGHTVAASVRPYGIYSMNHSFVIIQNVDVKEVTQGGIFFENNDYPQGTADTYYNNNFNEYNIIENDDVWNYGRADFYSGGIYVQSFVNSNQGNPQLRGWQILNNVVGRDDEPTPDWDYNTGGVVIRGTVGALVQGNAIATINQYGILASSDYGGQTCDSPTITKNTLGDNDANIIVGHCSNAIITYNTIEHSHGEGIGLGGNESNVTAAYNLLYDLRPSLDNILYNGFDINGATSGHLYHNTAVNVSISAMTLEGNNPPSNGWDVEDNIFSCNQNYNFSNQQNGNSPCVYIDSDDGVNSYTFKNNLWLLSNASSTSFEFPLGQANNYTSFRTLTGETGGVVVTDAGFVNSSVGDFTLTPNSPAINAGINIAGFTANDFLGSVVPQGPKPDMGAYEYKQTVAPVITINSPIGGATVFGTTTPITASVSATAPSSITAVNFYLDNVLLGSSSSTSSPLYNWDTTSASNTDHSLIAVAADSYGNIATSSAINLTVSNAAPSVLLFALSGIPITLGGSVPLSWVVLNSTHIYIDNGIGDESSNASSSVIVSPSVSTIYTLTAVNGFGTTTAQTTVTVLSPPSGGGGGGGGGGSYYNPIVSGSNNASSTNASTTSVTNTGSNYSATSVLFSLLYPTYSTSSTKLINDKGTFYLEQQGMLYGITSPGILKSYGFTFADAELASPDDLSLPQGGILFPADGSLVKSPLNPTVFLISDGQRYGFTSEPIFKGLSYKYSSLIIPSDFELQKVPFGENISSSTSAHKNGADVYYHGTVYWINQGTRYPYASIATYNSWHVAGDFSTVVPANKADLALPVGDAVVPRVLDK